MSLIESTAWQALATHYKEQIAPLSLQQLFAGNESRFAQFSVEADGLLMDYSKHRITGETLKLLVRLIEERELGRWTDALFSGAPVNSSEGRPALHTALRAASDQGVEVNGQAVYPQVQASLGKMAGIVAKIHAGQWRGYSGKPITDIVNLGVGGSDLGPLMICHALEEFRHADAAGLNLHFVSSIDGSQLAERLGHLNQETTVFILSSKSFTTIDTLANAEAAKRWLAQKIDNEAVLLRQHFIGCSANPEKMSERGIPPQNQLLFWDWVGGRYSLWSVIGLPIALLLGMDGFRQLLRGAAAMDAHFRTAPPAANMPVLMALLGVWSSNFLGVKGHAVLPYDGRMRHFPGYLTQLEMESNGKSVDRDGNPIDYDTCPIIWGDVGPNAQHAFYQLLHQGTQPVSCDFLAPVLRYRISRSDGTQEQLQDQQVLTLANCLGQSRVLMLGDQALAEGDPRRGARNDQHYNGNQGSTTLLYPELTPYVLGQLVALYEHKVFVQAVIWHINPFDQWGVELGKVLAQDTFAAIKDCQQPFDDSSSQGLLAYIARVRG
ncbi:glucose-6-phosphate isomerase [Motiliproteus sediminis]|uniref:glucose-6-phosphate isomerase n=1 Tax=Motiliproteus sediminis TaxID=1468178 RepID=UPI001AF005B5|nr:glucose-6-phosphate isomerase [Motiliproteus sediminis]